MVLGALEILSLNAEFSGLWEQGFIYPLFWFLVKVVDLLPGHSLGWAIVILTLVVRSFLFIPTFKALKSQKELKELQPKIKEIQAKYKNDQKVLTEKTMALYKEHGVNPFGSCLPLLIQMPILLAVYRVLQTPIEHPGLVKLFYNFDLTVPDPVLLPVTVALTQFISMKLMNKRQSKKIHDITPHDKEPKAMHETEAIMRTMTYVMPLLIAWIARGLPAGLSVYWIISTLFSIVQTLMINGKKSKEQPQTQAIS